jgi:LysM repeat protein
MKVSNPFIPPLVPTGNPARVRTTVIVMLASQAVLLAVLLIQGCKPSVADSGAAPEPAVSAGTTNTNTTTFESAWTNSATAPTNAATMAPGTNAPDLVISNALMPAMASSADTNSAAASKGSYTVVSGDSFYKIAQANHISLRALQAANAGVSPRKLKVGQVLNLPEAAETSAATPSALSTTNAANGVYVVKSGDTLSRIARSQHTTVKELRALNNLTTDRIVGGQKLKVTGATDQS